MTYTHTQKSLLDSILLLAFAVLLGAACWLAADPVAFYTLVGVAGVMLLAAACFGSLTIEDAGDGLQVRYGPLPLFRKRIAYSAIRSARPGRSSIVDGWGIHWVPGRGWTWNLWGLNCVELDVGGKMLRIGSDDAENLAAFLRTRIKASGPLAANGGR